MTWTKTRRKIQAILIFLCCIRQVRSLLKGVCHDRSLLQVAWLDIDMIYLYSKNRKLNIESELRISIIYIYIFHLIRYIPVSQLNASNSLPSFQVHEMFESQTWMRGGIWILEILAVLETPFTPIWCRRWRPQDPACHLQRWGRQRVPHLCWKTHGVWFFPYTGLPWITLLLKGFFVVFTVWGLCRYNLNFCYDNQPPAGGREVSSGPCSTWTGVQKEHPWPLLFTEKKGGRFWRVDLAGLLLNLWKVSGKMKSPSVCSLASFIQFSSEAFERHTPSNVSKQACKRNIQMHL